MAKQTNRRTVKCKGFSFTDCCRNPHVRIYSSDDPGTALDLSRDASGDCLHPLSLPGRHCDRDPPRVFIADWQSASRLPRCAERPVAAPLFSSPWLRAVSPFVLCRSVASLGLGVRPGCVWPRSHVCPSPGLRAWCPPQRRALFCCSCGSWGAHLRSGLMGVGPGRCPVAELAPRGSATGGRQGGTGRYACSLAWAGPPPAPAAGFCEHFMGYEFKTAGLWVLMA